MLQLDETIVAIASAPGGALRGIVRLSGPQAVDCLCRLVDESAAAAIRALRAATALDVSLPLSAWRRAVGARAYIWPTSASYTRQPTVELHLPGSPPLLEAVTRALVAVGARPAAPGEFTLRAFLAGRLDLTQAEAVLGVIDAADRRQLETALTQLAGGLAAPLRLLRSDLLDLLADLEAGLDFVEEDIQFVRADEITARLLSAAAAVDALERQMESRRAGIRRPRIVLAGEPNVGKSSLFNALTQRGEAIVSATPGATRDYLTADVEFGGVAAELVDTAGLSDRDNVAPDGELERAAQIQSGDQHAAADVLLLCLDATCLASAEQRGLLALPEPIPRLVVHTKCDLPRTLPEDPSAWPVSAQTGAGLPQLREAIRLALLHAMHDEASVAAGTAVRCRDSVRLAAESLSRAAAVHAAAAGDELLAVELRTALDELGKVAGVVYTDDVLDRVFGRFCIGK